MSEKNPKENYGIVDFDPLEIGRAIIFLYFEYKDALKNLPEEEDEIWFSKVQLLSEEIKKGEEEGDLAIIRGLTSELKGLLLKLGCPSDRMEKKNLVQFYEARVVAAQKEIDPEGGGRRRSIRPAKEKRIQKLTCPPKFCQRLGWAYSQSVK